MRTKRSQKVQALLAAGLCLGLSACGQSSSVPTPAPAPAPAYGAAAAYGAAPAPSPAPTPSPTPTPPPTLGTNAALTDLRSDQVFAARYASLQYDKVAMILTQRGFIAADASTSLRYTAATPGYTYTLENRAYTDLTPTQQFRIADSTTDGNFTAFQNTEPTPLGSNIYRLRLSRPGTVNTRISLNYAGFGSFEYEALTRYATGSIDYRPFSYAIATDAAGLARSGLSEYSGVIDGRIIPKTTGNYADELPVTGTLVLRVDFSGRILNGTVTLNTNKPAIPSDPAPVQQALGSYTLSSTALASLAALSGSVGNGHFAGVLAGPNAEELSLTMSFDFPYTSGSRTVTVTLVASGAARR